MSRRFRCHTYSYGNYVFLSIWITDNLSFDVVLIDSGRFVKKPIGIQLAKTYWIFFKGQICGRFESCYTPLIAGPNANMFCMTPSSSQLWEELASFSADVIIHLGSYAWPLLNNYPDLCSRANLRVHEAKTEIVCRTLSVSSLGVAVVMDKAKHCWFSPHPRRLEIFVFHYP